MVTVKDVKFGSLDAKEIVSTRTGASMKICLFGGTVISYKSSDGVERLFLSEKAISDGSKPIRGGIPVVFPQFGSGGANGKLPSHGFARTCVWKFLGYEPEDDFVRFGLCLTDNEQTRKIWPHKFILRLNVEFNENSFRTELQVTNAEDASSAGDKIFHFEALLHTYYLLGDQGVSRVCVKGLDGVKYIDQLRDYGDKIHVQSGDLFVDREVDWIYKKTLSDEESNEIIIEKEGKNKGDKHEVIKVRISLKKGEEEQPCDAVVWNPWIKKSKAMADFGDEEYKSMLCVEPGCVSRYEPCLPEETWSLSQHVTFTN